MSLPELRREQPPDPVPPPEPPDQGRPNGGGGAGTLNDDWLRDFYKECGREITLAYTTLNQMKNWAIVVQAAIVAATVSFVRSSAVGASANYDSRIWTAIVVGAVFSHLFTVRFFVRAITCYNNLLRWNTLQSSIVASRLSSPGVVSEDKLHENIQNYYHSWRAPISRTQQVSSNLKLGFGLLIVVPVTIVAVGAFSLWSHALVRGLVVAAIVLTGWELYDFAQGPLFDDVNATRRKGTGSVFPGPSGDRKYLIGWLLAAAGGLFAACWSNLLDFIRRLLC